MTIQPEVLIEFQDIVLAIKHAELRRFEAVYAGLKDKFFGSHLSQLDILKREAAAVCAEIVVSKWLGLKLALRINTFHREADLGDDIEVRCVVDPKRELVIRPNDNYGRRFVLVHIGKNKGKIIGWIWGYEGMVDDYKANPNGKGEAWFVPQSRLYGMDSFKQCKKGEQ
jgi:hypothetical protein